MIPGQDVEFNVRMLLKCSKIVAINQVLYHWVFRKESISWRKGEARHLYERVKILQQCSNLCIEMSEREKGFFNIELTKRFLSARYAANNDQNLKRLLQFEKKEVKESFFSDKTISFNYRIVMGMMYYCPWLYDAFIQFNELKAKVCKK